MRLLVTRHDLQARDTKALGPIRTREIEEVQFAGADSSRRGNSNGREIDPVMHRNGARRRLRAPEDVRGKAGPACRPAGGGCPSAGVSARVRRCRACEAPGEPGPHHHHDFVGRGRGRLCRGGGLAPRWAPGQGPRVPAQGAAIRSQPAGGAGDAQPQHARRRGDAEGRRGGAGEPVAARGGADGNRSDRCRQARRLREGPRVGTEAAFARAARLARARLRGRYRLLLRAPRGGGGEPPARGGFPEPEGDRAVVDPRRHRGGAGQEGRGDRKSTRLNSSHSQISYAVFCLKKKNKTFTRQAIIDAVLGHISDDRLVLLTNLACNHLSMLSAADLTYILFFFFNDTATTEIYTLSLHDALPI